MKETTIIITYKKDEQGAILLANFKGAPVNDLERVGIFERLKARALEGWQRTSAEALVERVNKDDEYEKARAQSIQPLIAELQELRAKLAKDQDEAIERANKRKKKNSKNARRPAAKKEKPPVKGDKDQSGPNLQDSK